MPGVSIHQNIENIFAKLNLVMVYQMKRVKSFVSP